MANGKLEARITFTTAQVMTVAITAVAGTPFTVTVAAGSYFPTALLAELKTQLDAASGADGTFTVSASIGEGGRNAALHAIGVAVHLAGANDTELEAHLLAVNALRCNPSLPEREVMRIAKSATRANGRAA